jgi:arsenate reductase (glutaredoxin)
MTKEKIIVWHKPSCSKCINVMEFFESHGIIPDEWREYLVDTPTIEEIRDVLRKLNVTAEQMVRKKEPVFIEKYDGKQLSEDEFITAMHEHPELIQRPIIIKGNTAFFGRSEDDLNQLLR